jgi:hypothetical protein
VVALAAAILLCGGCGSGQLAAPPSPGGTDLGFACSSLAPAVDATWRGRTMADFRPIYTRDQAYCVTGDRSSITLTATSDDPKNGSLLSHQLALSERHGHRVAMVDTEGAVDLVYGLPPQQRLELNGYGTSTIVPATVPRALFGIELIARRGSRYVRLSLTSVSGEALSMSGFDLPGAVQVAQSLLASSWNFPGCSREACRAPVSGS